MLIQEELDFLRESNNIEDEWDDLALQDSILAWQYIKDQEQLTKENILETHRLLMQHRDTIGDKDKGHFRTGAVWIGGKQAKPWFVVPELVEQWQEQINHSVQDKMWLTDSSYAKRIVEHHVQYEAIHPFADGNGRTGRIFMNWEQLKAGLPIRIIKEKEKYEYYKWFN